MKILVRLERVRRRTRNVVNQLARSISCHSGLAVFQALIKQLREKFMAMNPEHSCSFYGLTYSECMHIHFAAHQVHRHNDFLRLHFRFLFHTKMEKHLHRTQTNILYLVRPFVSCHIKCWLINSINLSLSSPSQQNDKQDFSKSTDTEKARDKIWKRKRVREKCIDNGPSFSAAHIHFIGVPFWPKKLYIGQARQKNPIWCQIFICTFGAFETMQCLPHETAANICSTFPLRAANYYAMLPFPRKAHFLANGKKREIQ